jgi:hypothetical protein
VDVIDLADLERECAVAASLDSDLPAHRACRLTRSTDLAEQDFPGDIRLANAVARICLNAIQERLPDFVLLTEGGFVHVLRRHNAAHLTLTYVSGRMPA